MTVALATFGSAWAAADDATEWQQFVIVSHPTQEDPLLEAGFNLSVGKGVPMVFAAQAIGDLNRFVDGRTAAGKSTTLSLGLVADSVQAAYAAKWTANDGSKFLLALQKEMDGDPRPSNEYFQQEIAKVQPGRTLDQVLGDKAAPAHARVASAPH